MNQLWVRISLTYIGIVIFLILIPSVFYLTYQADEINLAYSNGEVSIDPLDPGVSPQTIFERLSTFPRMELVTRLIRILLSISLVGILVGVISSRGLAAPLRNLAIAARAVGSQDLTQRIEVSGTDEVREVAVAFNAMAAALEEAEELRNNMLADIAHELRTPLSVIQGNLRAILDDVYKLDKVEVARLYDQTRQLSRLVGDLHDLALLEANQFSLNLTELNMIDLMLGLTEIYQPIFKDQGVQLYLDIPDEVSVVRGDHARITQCLNNLLNNALRHTTKGGEVRVGLSEKDNRVEISVSDNGVGIEKEHLPHVFNRFYRVDSDRNRKTGGTGLGLAITQALVTAHEGKVTVASDGCNTGSQFTIHLPC
jgi:signal transduction histidine kinase